MKLLIYAINGKGMGHLNRTLVMARALRQFDPRVEIRFAVGSPLYGLVSSCDFEVIKIPDRHHLLGYHSARPARDWGIADLFGCLFDEFHPDVFLVDLAVDELLFRRANAAGAKVALVWRKQRPESIAEAKRRMGMRRVERLLIPHDESEATVEELPESWRPLCRHLGPVARSLDLDRVAQVRARFAEPEQPLVVVTAGGGGYPETHDILRAAEQVARRSDTGTRWVVVYGPYYRGDIPASEHNVTRLRFEADLPELMTAANAVVCSAGYNILRELDLAGTPAVVLPIAGTGRDDQVERAATLVSRSRALSSAAEPDELTRKLQLVLDGRIPRASPNGGDSNRELGARIAQALQE